MHSAMQSIKKREFRLSGIILRVFPLIELITSSIINYYHFLCEESPHLRQIKHQVRLVNMRIP